MKTSTIIKQLLTAASLIALTSTTVYAHSNHDHSNIPVKWNFTQNAQAKLIQYLTSNTKSSAIGLSKLDQETLSDYGINVGNKFAVMMDSVSLKVERTTLGIKILTANKNLNDNSLQEIPIRDMNTVSKVSMTSHSGHDHKVLNKAWTFAPKTAAKISKKVEKGNYPALVGLSAHERKVLDAYNIKVGNTLKTRVSGEYLTVTRTSGGLMIDQDINLEVASANQAQELM
jgi:hypothetical protein